MLGIDERLGLAIAALLLEIGADGVAAEMPDDRRRAEPDRVAGVLKAPADVDVITSRAVDRVKAAERQQRVAAERHIAAGNVLGNLVADQDMRWPAGRHCHGRRHEAVLGRGKVGSAAGREIARFHLGDEVGQPVRVGDAVAVGIGDDLAARRLGPDISCDAQPLVGLADDAAEREALSDLERAVGRAVIDDDDLVIGVVEGFERGEAGLHCALCIVGAHHDRDPGIARQRRRQHALVAAGDLVKGWLRPALPVDEAERPVFDLMSAGEPLIGPGKDKSAGNAGRKGGAHLPAEDAGLLVRAVAHRVDAELGQDERLVDREIVQPRDIATERRLLVQVDVEAEEIREIDGQIFGRGKIGVADQRAGMLLAHQPDQFPQETPHGFDAVPSDHVWRDLVPDEIGEHSGVTTAGAHPTRDRGADLRLDRGAVEEGHMLRPGQPDQHLEPCLLGGIEQPDRRHGEHPDGVGARAAHQRKVVRDGLDFRELRAVAPRAEGTVGHALDEMLGIPRKEELALDPDLAFARRRTVRQNLRAGRHLQRHAAAVDRAHLASLRIA